MNLKTALMIGMLCWVISVSFAQAEVEFAPITPENVQNLTELASLSRGGFRELVWSPVDERVAILTSTGAWLYTSTVDAPIPLTIIDGYEIDSILTFSPDGRYLVGLACLYRACVEQQTILWDGFTGQRLVTIPNWSSREVRSVMEFSPTGQTLVVSVQQDIVIYNLADLIATGEPEPIAIWPEVAWQIRQMHFSPDGQKLLVVVRSPIDRLIAWDIATQTILYQIEFAERIGGNLNFSPDGRYAFNDVNHYYYRNDHPLSIYLFRVDDGLLIATYQAYALKFSADSQRLVVSRSGEVQVIRLADQSVLTRHRGVSYGMYSPDGALIVGDQNGQIRWLRGERVERYEYYPYPVIKIVFSVDHRQWLSYHQLPNGELRISVWTGQNRVNTSDLQYATDALTAQFDARGQRVAIGDRDSGVLEIWDLQSHTRQTTFNDVFNPGYWVGFDQETVVTSNANHTYFWQKTANGLSLSHHVEAKTLKIIPGGFMLTQLDGWFVLQLFGRADIVRRITPTASCSYHYPSFSRIVITERYFACISNGNAIEVWRLNNGESVIRINMQDPFHIQGDQLLIRRTEAIEVWDLQSQALTVRYPITTAEGSSLHWNSRQLLAINADYQLVSLSDHTTLFTLPQYVVDHYTITDCNVPYAPLDCSRRQLPFETTVYYDWVGHFFSPSGRFWVGHGQNFIDVYQNEFQLAVWDLQDRHAIIELPAKINPFAPPSFNHAETLMIQPYQDAYTQLLSPLNYTAEIFDLITGEDVHILKGGKDSFKQITFTPDDRLLLTYSDTLRVWGAVP